MKKRLLSVVNPSMENLDANAPFSTSEETVDPIPSNIESEVMEHVNEVTRLEDGIEELEEAKEKDPLEKVIAVECFCRLNLDMTYSQYRENNNKPSITMESLSESDSINNDIDNILYVSQEEIKESKASLWEKIKNAFRFTTTNIDKYAKQGSELIKIAKGFSEVEQDSELSVKAEILSAGLAVTCIENCIILFKDDKEARMSELKSFPKLPSHLEIDSDVDISKLAPMCITSLKSDSATVICFDKTDPEGYKNKIKVHIDCNNPAPLASVQDGVAKMEALQAQYKEWFYNKLGRLMNANVFRELGRNVDSYLVSKAAGKAGYNLYKTQGQTAGLSGWDLASAGIGGYGILRNHFSKFRHSSYILANLNKYLDVYHAQVEIKNNMK